MKKRHLLYGCAYLAIIAIFVGVISSATETGSTQIPAQHPQDEKNRLHTDKHNCQTENLWVLCRAIGTHQRTDAEDIRMQTDSADKQRRRNLFHSKRRRCKSLSIATYSILMSSENRAEYSV